MHLKVHFHALYYIYFKYIYFLSEKKYKKNTHHTLHITQKKKKKKKKMHVSDTTFDLLPLVFNRGPFEGPVAVSCN